MLSAQGHERGRARDAADVALSALAEALVEPRERQAREAQ
jgi:hypothetical protein